MTEGRNPKIRLWSLPFELYRTWNCQRLIICLERVSDQLETRGRCGWESKDTPITWHDHSSSLQKVAQKYTFSSFLTVLLCCIYLHERFVTSLDKRVDLKRAESSLYLIRDLFCAQGMKKNAEHWNQHPWKTISVLMRFVFFFTTLQNVTYLTLKTFFKHIFLSFRGVTCPTRTTTRPPPLLWDCKFLIISKLLYFHQILQKKLTLSLFSPLYYI